MKRYLFFTSLVLWFMGCSSYPVNHIPPKHTFVKEEKKVTQETATDSKVFQKNDHRYDARYQNFNYDSLGYSNNAGSYYGYYDRDGYFYNNRYYNYDDRYNYNDRYSRRGAFSLDSRHDRQYLNNGWNQSHESYQPNYTRVHHPREGRIDYGDISYQNSHENVKNRIDTRGY